MMGGVSPETYWASYKYEIDKNVDTLLHLVGFSLWITEHSPSESESPVHRLRYPANKHWHITKELFHKRVKSYVFATCLLVFRNKRTGAVCLDYV